MDMTKLSIGAVLGGIVYFFLGFLIYGLAIGDNGPEIMGGSGAAMRAQDDLVMWALALGNIFMGLTLTFILMKIGISSPAGGATNGAIVGFLFALGYDMIMFATTTMVGLQGVFIDACINGFTSACAGAAIGWWLGRK